MNNTLYEITDKYLKVLDNLEIDEETGEILNAEELDELSGACLLYTSPSPRD